jgi:hypothetical protein
VILEWVAAVVDPDVWSGRASQEGLSSWLNGLAQMYPASDWSSLLRATMDISARAILLPDRPRSGPLGSPVFASAGKTDLHLSVSSRRPRRVPLSLRLHGPVPLFVPGAVPPSRPANPLLRRAQARSRPARSAARLGLDAAEHGASIRRAAATAHCLSSPRSCALEPALPKRSGRACWRAQLPTRCGASASWRLQSSS